MNRFPHEFETLVELHDFGRMAYSVVYLPAAIAKRLGLKQHPRLRVRGEVNGAPVSGGCNPTGKDRWYLILSKRYLKQCRAALGERVYVQLEVADQNAVDVPLELQRALEANGKAEQAWAELTAGKQRGFAYRVAGAKRAETRERRVEEVIDCLVTGRPLR